MSNNNITEDSLSELRAGMDALKNSLPSQGIISSENLRKTMRSKSLWLNRFVIMEIIAVPIYSIVFLGLVVVLNVNIWCVLFMLILSVISIFFDKRTLYISGKWIQEESLVGLSRNLARQKVERRRQTLIELPLALIWVAWFFFEFLKSINYRMALFSEDGFIIAWAIATGAAVLLSLILIWIVYKEAQRTNDELIKKIDAFIAEAD